MRISTPVLALLTLASACAKPTLPLAPLAVTASVCRPEFHADNFQYQAGTAFLLTTDKQDRTLLVTASHLFGPEGGLKEQIPWNEMSARVRMIGCAPFKRAGAWRADAPLAISGAGPKGDENTLLDIAAFPVSSAEDAPTLRPAAKPPVVGDSVWLAAEIIQPPLKTDLLHHATVVAISDHALIFAYDQSLGLTATSGAPIVNENGEVVGVNRGGGESSPGKLVGVATAWKAIDDALRTAK